MAIRLFTVIMGIIIMIASLLPLLQHANVSVAGFSVAEKFKSSKLPKSATPYLIACFLLGLLQTVIGIRHRKIVY